MKNKKKCLLERLIGFVSFFLTFSLKKMFEIIIFDFKIQMFAFYEYRQGLVKGAKLCFRNPYFYFWHGESTSTASQLTSPASQKSKDLNKVSLLLQDLALVRNYWFLRSKIKFKKIAAQYFFVIWSFSSQNNIFWNIQ